MAEIKTKEELFSVIAQIQKDNEDLRTTIAKLEAASAKTDPPADPEPEDKTDDAEDASEEEIDEIEALLNDE